MNNQIKTSVKIINEQIFCNDMSRALKVNKIDIKPHSKLSELSRSSHGSKI